MNASQQVGGSIGTALLSTIVTSATASAAASAPPTPPPALLATATVHGYTTAFTYAFVLFIAGALVTGLLYRPGVRVLDSAAEPALAH